MPWEKDSFTPQAVFILCPPPAPTLTVCIIASSFYNFGCFIFVFCVFCFGLVFWWLFIYLVVVVVVSWGL